MLISRRQGFARTTGIYMHLPSVHNWRVAWRGYVRLVLPNRFYTFWYMGNPHRHRIFESFENTDWL